ncbi:hypothetical protein PHYC_01308 [Phycisphaerales bacterium]|nr:hypothetical protein PHYC_01308 [Phycisphaerales bacterium]
MSEMAPASWGHASRHYAEGGVTGIPAKAAGAPSPMERRWAELLEKATPGVRDTVERTYKQWNGILRDYMRTETALRLTVGDEAQAVPVRVVAGMPRPFAQVIEQFDGLEWLLLNRARVEDAQRGSRFMLDNYGSLLGEVPDDAEVAEPEHLIAVENTAAELLKLLEKIDAVKRIIGIEEDVLGAYFFRVPEIRLYWMVIGIIASALDVSPEALTIVVLTHELAHAYTHLGRDIDNEQWDTGAFAGSDLDIVEGLAQFYTNVICQRLEPRMPGALRAYKALLEKQSGSYRAHLDWVGGEERGGEIVRVAMIECRSQRMTESAKFGQAIDRHRKQVKGREKPVKAQATGAPGNSGMSGSA